MKVKIFHAVTMQDAMRAIKEELGPDAIILSSKEVREGGRLLRVFNRPVLEIMAAAEHEAQQPPQLKDSRQNSDRSIPLPAAQPPSPAALQTFQQTLQTMLQLNHEAITPSVDRPSAPSKLKRPQLKRQGLHHLRSAMTELSSLIQDLSHENTQAGSPAISPFLMTLRRTLIAGGLDPATATALGMRPTRLSSMRERATRSRLNMRYSELLDGVSQRAALFLMTERIPRSAFSLDQVEAEKLPLWPRWRPIIVKSKGNPSR